MCLIINIFWPSFICKAQCDSSSRGVVLWPYINMYFWWNNKKWSLGLSRLDIFSVFIIWLSLILNPSCFFLPCFQISPLRPQRPKSQVINVLGDKRLSVSPGPAVPQTTSTLPPPITPRVKHALSMLSSSSKFHLIVIFYSSCKNQISKHNTWLVRLLCTVHHFCPSYFLHIEVTWTGTS